MELNPNDLPWKSVYKLMIGAVVPRPIGWISTLNPEGVPNLAPFSYFNAVGSNPPHLLFAPNVRGTDLGEKDTLHNVQSTGEFVANIVTEALAEAMNRTSQELPPGTNEFEVAELTAEPSQVVAPPRVAESPAHFECRVTHVLTLGEGAGAGRVVIGRVVHIHVSDEVLFDGDKIDLEALRPIGRLAGSRYCRVTDLFDLTRPPSLISKK